MKKLIRRNRWLLPVVLILFILEVILFPLAAGITYAGRDESPDHILTYTTGNLAWDSATGVDEETGAAQLSLFDSVYQNVLSENEDKLVAPGTEGRSIVRLKNDEDYSVRYIAVIYCVKEEDDLPVSPELSGKGFTDTDIYPLPEGVDESQVVRAVSGTVAGGEIQDFDIEWLWRYYESDERDLTDTALGDKAAFDEADEITAGLYIVVEDDADTELSGSDYVYPGLPKTGDFGRFELYAGLMVISGILLILLIHERRKDKKC